MIVLWAIGFGFVGLGESAPDLIRDHARLIRGPDSQTALGSTEQVLINVIIPDIMFLCLSVTGGVYISLGLQHWKRSHIWIAWFAFMLCACSLPYLSSLLPELVLSAGSGYFAGYARGILSQWRPAVYCAVLCYALTLLGIPIGRAMARGVDRAGRRSWILYLNKRRARRHSMHK